VTKPGDLGFLRGEFDRCGDDTLASGAVGGASASGSAGNLSGITRDRELTLSAIGAGELNTVPDEIMMSIAAALAGKAAEVTFSAMSGAWRRLLRLAGDRLDRDGHGGAAALESAREHPDDAVAVRQLAGALEEIARADSGFAATIRELWAQSRLELSASEGGVVNVSSGTVRGHLIQARDLSVQGGLHLGDVTGEPGT
jgi:hypothetical protein